MDISSTLAARWTFPSEHLPVGLTVRRTCDNDFVSVVSWNVLHSSELNAQSLPPLYQQPVGPSAGKEFQIADKVFAILKRLGTIVCLQKCSKTVLTLISQRIASAWGSRFQIITTDGTHKDLGVIILDKEFYKVQSHKAFYGIYSDDPADFILEASIQTHMKQFEFKIINTHIPPGAGSQGAGSQGKDELAAHLRADQNPNKTTILVGDMNQTALEISKAITPGFQSIAFPYYSHIDTQKERVDYDQAFVEHRHPLEVRISQIALEEMDPQAERLVKSLNLSKQG